ncbi:MAG: amidase [Rhodobacteraceae bacterium]|uniref:amidase n=1 Tax=Albidovulum sp. TaxID=1872424 RepID=UPI001DC8BB4E|nr:amidase [Paracoccaceae bacterium]HPE24232.1 amidase [Albidovulum sp.]MCB2121981.1 amidase [Paracoccaceae bacterium]MCB2131897.1 amidase [Paracoccaceae bacterium]MCB2141939.1 amidase [Paracoccaceae bacterium]
MFKDYGAKDATDLAGLVASGEVDADALLDTALAAMERLNPKLNAVVLVQEEAARAAIRRGLPEGPFRGVPFLLKDLGCEAMDFPSHNGSRLFANTRYALDSAIWDRIRATGVVAFARTTAPEGGVGPATESAVYGGPTRNPWDLSRTPGGSSGGAGAAVAAGIVPAAHGSDGGGSVRIPASSCGLFGFKATRARFPDGPYSGEGWAGMAIDGFLTRSVRDAAAFHDACAGADLGAPYWAPPLGAGHIAAIRRPPRRLRVALCDTTLDGRPIHPDCAAAVHDAARLLESLGHHVEPARPAADIGGMMRAWTDIVACGTALSIRAKCAARGHPLEPGEVENVALGAIDRAAAVSGADYLAAVGKIHAFGRELSAFFDPWDILLTATLAEPPAMIGRFAHTDRDFVHFRTGPGMVFDYSPFCAAFNASGQPAASVPLFWNGEGLPIGVHLATRFGADEELMALCAELESARPWAGRRPPLTV